jgi:hypothetical protein
MGRSGAQAGCRRTGEAETDMMGKVMALATDPKNRLAAALASLGRVFMVRDS